MLKKNKIINIVLIFFCFSFVKGELKINDFEYKINNSIINLFQSKLDSILLDSNNYIGELKEQVKKSNNILTSVIYKEFKFLLQDEKIEKTRIRLGGQFRYKLNLSKINILKNSEVININHNERGFLYLVFLEDLFDSEKIFSIHFLTREYFNESNLDSCFKLVSNILVNPDTINYVNSVLYSQMKREDYQGRIKLNDIKEFISNDYNFNIFQIYESKKCVDLFFDFKNNENTLYIQLEYNIESDKFKLNSIILGNFKKDTSNESDFIEEN